MLARIVVTISAIALAGGCLLTIWPHTTVGQQPVQRATPALSILSETALPPSDLTNFGSIVGEVRNDGRVPVAFTKVRVTYYDAAGRVVGTSFSYVSATDNTLQPGAVGPFRITTHRREWSDRYRLQVETSN